MAESKPFSGRDEVAAVGCSIALALANPSGEKGHKPLCSLSKRQDSVCGLAVTTGLSSDFLLAVITLQFKNHTNVSESTLSLL